MNPSPGTEMPIYARTSGLAWLGVCKHLCVWSIVGREPLEWVWRPQWALVRVQFCPSSDLTKPGLLCLWDFSLVHARFI